MTESDGTQTLDSPTPSLEVESSYLYFALFKVEKEARNGETTSLP